MVSLFSVKRIKDFIMKELEVRFMNAFFVFFYSKDIGFGYERNEV